MTRLDVGPESTEGQVVAAVRAWVDEQVPRAWLDAGRGGGADAVRRVRTLAAYEAWYPAFADSGLVAPTWPVAYGGLGLSAEQARVAERELVPFRLGRLNPLGLNNTAPALFEHGTEAQRLRYLPPIVRDAERWCQLFSEPGAGSDLASLATRATRDGDEWRITGQKVWTTWAHRADFAVLLARTDPGVPKHRGITFFLLDLHQPGVDVRPLRHITGEVEFNEVFLEGAVVPDAQRVGAIDNGWRVAGATLAGERQMVAGSGSGGVDRIGGRGVGPLVDAARSGAASVPDPTRRAELVMVLTEERIREWTNHRVREGRRAGRTPGPESSIGKVHQGALNQRLQELAVRTLGSDAVAWIPDADDPCSASHPAEVRAMLRSRANTIEGGTTEVNKNILGERVLGLPREPDPWRDVPWREVPELMSDETHYETLRVERHGPVGWLVFDRPEAANAMDARMMEELERAWPALDADPDVRVIVNTGTGAAFQTGLDVAQLAGDPEALREASRRTKRAELRLTAWHHRVWKPVIAAVNGVCAGGGLHFVADADVVIASSDAELVDPHVSLGQVSAFETIVLARKSPMEAVLRMAFVGREERMPARRAHELGILSEIVDPPAGLVARAQALGETIARNSPAAMAATKRALWGALELGLTDASRAGAREQISLRP